MGNSSYENSTVATVAQKPPEARAYRREARIDITSRLFSHDAAAAAGVIPDELLAQIAARTRRKDRHIAARVAEIALAIELGESQDTFMLI